MAFNKSHLLLQHVHKHTYTHTHTHTLGSSKQECMCVYIYKVGMCKMLTEIPLNQFNFIYFKIVNAQKILYLTYTKISFGSIFVLSFKISIQLKRYI